MYPPCVHVLRSISVFALTCSAGASSFAFPAPHFKPSFRNLAVLYLEIVSIAAPVGRNYGLLMQGARIVDNGCDALVESCLTFVMAEGQSK